MRLLGMKSRRPAILPTRPVTGGYPPSANLAMTSSTRPSLSPLLSTIGLRRIELSDSRGAVAAGAGFASELGIRSASLPRAAFAQRPRHVRAPSPECHGCPRPWRASVPLPAAYNPAYCARARTIAASRADGGSDSVTGGARAMQLGALLRDTMRSIVVVSAAGELAV